VNRKRALQLGVGLVIAAVCLYFAFRGVDWGEFTDAIVGMPWYSHVLYVLALFAQFIIRSDRWAVQVEGVTGERPTFRKALAINAIAFPSVFLFPFRLGELVRPYLCERQGIMKAPVAIANTAVERILDGLVTTAMFGAVLALAPPGMLPEGTGVGGLVALGIFGGATVVLGVAFVFRDPSIIFWRRLIGVVHRGLAEKLVLMLEAFLDGLACFKGVRGFAHYFFDTVVFWGINGAAMWLLLGFMGQDVPLLGAYMTLCFLVIGVMIPAGPGSVGTFHAAATFGVGLFGVAEGPAAAFAVLLHAWQTLGLIAWASIFVVTGDVRLSQVRDATRVEEV
jgi:uncharacterized protein (TIRG00374 family)